MECISSVGLILGDTISKHSNNNIRTTNSMAPLTLITETTSTTGTTSTELSSERLAGAYVRAAAAVEPVIPSIFRNGNSQTTSALTHNLSKYERSMLSPEELKEYKRRSKNEKQKATYQQLSPSKRSQKLAMHAFRKRELRYQKKMDGVTTSRKKTYVSIQVKSAREQEEQRLKWKNLKANLRKKEISDADFKARSRVVELQAKLLNAESDLNQAVDLSSNDRGTHKELRSLQTIVDICRENLCSTQHLVNCHEAAADHDVYGVYDSDDCDTVKVISDYKVREDNITRNKDVDKGEPNIDGSCTDEVCSAKGSQVDVVNIEHGNVAWFLHDNIHVESDGTLADALPCQESFNDSLENKKNGKCYESAIVLTFPDDDGFDSSSSTPIHMSHYIDQQHRFDSTMVQVFGYAHASFWERRGNAESSSKGIAIARCRAHKLSIHPNDPGLTDLRRNKLPKKFGPDLEPIHSLATFKRMSPETRYITNTMSRRDFRQLLNLGLYLTDACIYMYSALLMERDHAMHLKIPGWKRSWIFGSHFYTLLSPNRQQHVYEKVKNYGARVPGKNA